MHPHRILSLLFLLLLSLALGACASHDARPAPEPGAPLPAVTLKDIGREKGSQGKGIIETASLILKKILDTAYDTAVRQGLNSLKDIAGESADTLKGTAENLKNSAKGLLGGLL